MQIILTELGRLNIKQQENVKPFGFESLLSVLEICTDLMTFVILLDGKTEKTQKSQILIKHSLIGQNSLPSFLMHSFCHFLLAT